LSTKKVWIITGAGRGLGVDIAKAALAAGNSVLATGRNPEAVARAVGDGDDLLAVKLDVTDPANAEEAVEAALERFGQIDVLVNNAGNFYAGFFEELTPEQMDLQLATTLIGPMNVTRAVLPVMVQRALRAGTGRIRAGGVERDVRFEEPGRGDADYITAATRSTTGMGRALLEPWFRPTLSDQRFASNACSDISPGRVGMN
jgi:NAD(P)-dependent dehydrogenase (short-subunit alcohol dehydrogenase family)